jgi:hypothetical protein
LSVNKLNKEKNRFAPAQRKLCTDLVQEWDSSSQVFIDSSGFYLVAFFCALTSFSQAMGMTFVDAVAGLQCNEYAEKVRNCK